MATETPTQDVATRSPAKHERFVEDQLNKVTRRIRWIEAGKVSLALLVAVSAYALIAALFDLWAGEGAGLWATIVRVGLLGVFGVVAALLLGMLAVRLYRQVNPYYAARELERTVPGAKNSVMNWLDLREQKLPPVILHALGLRAARDLKGSDPEKAVTSKNTWLLSALFVVLVLALMGLFASGPGRFISLMQRAFLPLSGTELAARTQIEILEPRGKNVTVALQQRVEFRVDISGRIPRINTPESPKLHYRYDPKEPHVTVPLERASDGTWVTFLTPDQIQQGLWYHFIAGDAATDEYRVQVQTLPQAERFAVTYHYRPYLLVGDFTVTYPNERSFYPEIKGHRGTEVTLLVRANREIVEGRIELEPGKKSLPGEILADDAQAFRVKFPLEESGSFKVVFVSKKGEENFDRSPHNIEVLDDLPPNVVLTKPAEDVKLPANGTLPIEGFASDDFGVKHLSLRVKVLEGAEKPSLLPRPYRPEKKLQFDDGGYPVHLEYRDFLPLDQLRTTRDEPFALVKGMVLEYWLEATDNSDYPSKSGNVGRSKAFKINIVDPVDEKKQQEQRQQAQKRRDQEQQKQDEKLEQQNAKRHQDQAQRDQAQNDQEDGKSEKQKDLDDIRNRLKKQLDEEEKSRQKSKQDPNKDDGNPDAKQKQNSKQESSKQESSKQESNKDCEKCNGKGGPADPSQASSKQNEGSAPSSTQKSNPDNKPSPEQTGQQKTSGQEDSGKKNSTEKNSTEKDSNAKNSNPKNAGEKNSAEKTPNEKNAKTNSKNGEQNTKSDQAKADQTKGDQTKSSQRPAETRGDGSDPKKDQRAGAEKVDPMQANKGGDEGKQPNMNPENAEPKQNPKTAQETPGKTRDEGKQPQGTQKEDPAQANKCGPQPQAKSDPSSNGEKKGPKQGSQDTAHSNSKPKSEQPTAKSKDNNDPDGPQQTAKANKVDPEQNPKNSGTAKEGEPGTAKKNSTSDNTPKSKGNDSSVDPKNAKQKTGDPETGDPSSGNPKSDSASNKKSGNEKKKDSDKLTNEQISKLLDQLNEKETDTKATDEAIKKLADDERFRKKAEEFLKKLNDTAKNSDDPEARKSAQKALDKLAERMREAQKRQDEQTANATAKGVGNGGKEKGTKGQPQKGEGITGKNGSGPQDVAGKGKVNSEFGKRSGQMQLDELKKRVTPEILKKAGISEEQWQQFLRDSQAYEEPRPRQKSSTDPKTLTGGNSTLPSTSPFRVNPNATGERSPLQSGHAQPPPGFREIQRRFTSRPNSNP